MIDFEALATDGSWQLTRSGNRLQEAVFRLSPHTIAVRGALLEQLGGDASDPEQWEAALIDALLTDPASAELRRLELHLTDFHHSARRAARARAWIRHEQLTALDPAGFPALRHRDLGAAEFDTDDYDTLVTLAESPLLPQLESLTLRSVYIHEHDIEGDRPTELAALAPAFAHLRLEVTDGADADVATILGIDG
ncbi:hypothetical protein AB0L82_37160 [Nocardia sp. NPDC052001]|uniref:hypothetical protein n=1 Tax=Nocardia sp. NPDC052001 TaxID=3154853 RepID=UPI0034239255